MKNKIVMGHAQLVEDVCKCCENLGIADIIAELAKQDVLADKQADGKKINKRTRQIKMFIDKDHEVQLRYYEIVTSEITYNKMLKEMRKLIDQDQDFLDPYLVVSDILFSINKDEEAEASLKEAYDRAILAIVDSKGRWPKEISWGFLENRHIMRALEQYAIYCWETKRIEEALDIFRSLLRVNPTDNQGVRYNILAIRMGLNFDDWQKPFEFEENGKALGLDAGKVSGWFEENAPKYEDDFQWLLDIYRAWDAD